MLKQLPEYHDASIVRTRDPEVIAKADIVVDVGAVYDPSTHRYDHHQREFTGTFDDHHKTRLSSAGLVYKHFGRRVIASLTSNAPEATIELIFQKLYDDFIEGIDGIDNGVNEYPAEVKANYKVMTDLGARVGWLNPAWNETGIDLDARFTEAMAITGHDFSHFVNYFSKSWLPARTVVESALKERFNVHPSGEIIVLDQFCPWKGHLEGLEKELNIFGTVKYAIFQDSGSSWRVQCMSVSSESFDNRKSLPERWWGKRDADLSTLSGIPGCIFIHATGFIGGAQTKESALRMAIAGLEAK
jgi:uncharacterized UPF0160 family protein